MAKKKLEKAETLVVPESPEQPETPVESSTPEEIKVETPPLTEQIQKLIAEAPENQRWRTTELAKIFGVPEMEVIVTWHNLYGHLLMNTRLYKA
jgi:hypothetical protein